MLGDGAYEFNDSQQQFTADSIENTVINVQGGSGALLAGQAKRASSQEFNGYIADAGVDKAQTEEYRRDFLNFFKINHYYEAVYVFADGTAVKRQRGYITDAPVVSELWQVHPEYHVALNFEDPDYYAYAEDENGNETFGQSAKLLLFNAVTGGFPYDKTGLIWDQIGAICKPRLGGTTTLNIRSTTVVFPVWVVEGPADNPQLVNLNTGGRIAFEGRVAEGQKLTIDMLNQTALINGTNVLDGVRGEWFSFAPGINRVNFITTNANAQPSRIEWQEVVF